MQHRRAGSAASRGLAVFAVIAGTCSLRPDAWPAAALPGWVSLPLVFGLALCAAAAAETVRLLPLRRVDDDFAAQRSLRGIARGLYLQIYLSIGAGEAADWLQAALSNRLSSSSLFKLGALGHMQPTPDLKMLVAYGIAAAFAARLGAWLWARQTPLRDRRERHMTEMRSSIRRAR